MALALPDGTRGRALAITLTVVVLAVLWLGVAAPLIAANADLAETRALREALAARMATAAATLPVLQHQVETAAAGTPQAGLAVVGASDAIAGAALQELIQDMARRAGVTVSSAEALPAEDAAPYRRIGVRLSVSGAWPVMIRFLQAIEESNPRMLVDDLQMQRAPVLFGADRPLDASFAVFGFRAASP